MRSNAVDTRARRVVDFLACVFLATATALIPVGAAVAEPTVEELETAVDEAAEELEIIVEAHNDLAEELEGVEERHADLETMLAPLQEQADASADELGDVAAALYRGGPSTTMSPMLTGSTDTLASRLSMLEYLGGDRAAQLGEASAAAAELEAEEQYIEELTEEYAQLQTEKADAEDEIDDAMTRLETARGEAVAAGWQDDPDLTAPAAPAGDDGAAAVAFVHDQLGAPYQWGGTGPGFDCSGLTSMAWSQAGVSLPHSAAGQYNATTRIGGDQLQPGDLVFYYDDIRHVGMYVGDGKIIHAPTAGQTVQVAAVDESPVHGYGRPA